MKSARELARAVNDALGRIHHALYALPDGEMGGLGKSAVRNVLTNLGPAIRAELMAFAEQARADERAKVRREVKDMLETLTLHKQAAVTLDELLARIDRGQETRR